MNQSREQFFRRVMEGSDRSPTAATLRAIAAGAEPFYAAMMRLRNGMYDCGILRTHSLNRPTISVGNITTGGTGKTPVVQWLATRLAAAGQRPAILIRGYKSTSAGVSDEAAELTAALQAAPGGAVPVLAGPDRLHSAADALRLHPQTTAFILDDGMQHRRARRDFELVLINAAEPFGYSRVFPRGLLREPMAGLVRADALLITHAREVPESELARIEVILRQHNRSAPIFRADHVIKGFRSTDDVSQPVELLAGKSFFAFCGIGSPGSFFATLDGAGGKRAGAKSFPDHHAYTPADLANLAALAQSSGAQMVITTEKDWARLCAQANVQPKMSDVPFFRARLALRFWGDHESVLLDRVIQAIHQPAPRSQL